MMPYGSGRYNRDSDRHMRVAAVAIFLSALVHTGLMYYFADWKLTEGSGSEERRRDWRSDHVPPMRVETMHTDPMRLAEKVAGERDTPSRGPIEAYEQVEALSQSVSPALTVPPPVPRDAVVPGVPVLKESAVSRPVDTAPWMPRQEIAQIFDRVVQDEVAALPRREIPMIERVPKAADIVPSIDLAGRRFGKDPEPPKPVKAADVFDTEISKGTFKAGPGETPSQVSRNATESRFGMQPGERNGKGGAFGSGYPDGTETAKVQKELAQKQALEAQKKLVETAATEEERKAREAQAQIAAMQDTIEYIPIDDMLAVGLETYRDPEEPSRIYFRIGIQPRADKHIPVVPKDIVWVQDVSASISEERLNFCRRGMAAALETMNPDDRFTVVSFRESFGACFPGWTAVTPENKRKAAEYIAAMHSFGQTDVFGSLQSLLKLPRDPKRPMVAFIVTDGKPTFGETESAKIIGSFSKLNSGLVSIYMFGTYSKANAYLLDMLTYCNRGAASVLTGNRWDIPGSMAAVYEGVRNPVMADITVVFDSASKSEVYPKNTANLYADRQLELEGVCPATCDEIVFQMRGLAAGKGYDSIFRLSLTRHAKLGSALIKTRWAQQKMFHLVGAYSRDPHQQTFAEMLKVNRQYGIKIPYEDELK